MGRRWLTVFTLLVVLVVTDSGLGSICLGNEAGPPDPAKERALAAQKIYEAWAAEFFAGRETALGVYFWSHRWMEAQRYLSRTAAEKLAAAEAHLAHMKDLEKVIMPAVAAQRRGVESYLGADFYRYDAETIVFEAKFGLAAEATVAAATRRLATLVLMYDARQKPDRTQAPNFFYSLFWSRQWFEAENILRPKTAERLANAAAYLSRAVELEKLAKDASSQPRYPMDFLHVATFYRLDAEILVSQLKADGRAGEPAHSEKAKARLEAAKAAYEARWQADSWFTDPEYVYTYSLSWRAAALALATTKAERVAANEAYLARMRELENRVEKVSERLSERYFVATQYYREEAEIFVSQAKAQ